MPRPSSPPGWLSGLDALTFVVLGDYVADEYVYGETDRISREAPVPIVRFERSELKLGAAGNVANNLRALGVRVRAVGAVGADPPGRAIVHACRSTGIDVRGLLEVPGVATSTKTRFLAGALHTTRQQLLRVDRGSPVEPAAAPRLARALAQAAHGADAVVVSDYGAGSAGSWAVGPCAALARRLPVLVDSRFHLGRFRDVTVAKPNTPELLALAALGGPVEARQLADLARRVLRRQRLSALLVTRGQDGLALYARGQKALELPVAGPRDAVDVTGAGDTVLAAFSAVFARTRDPRAAARIANVAGGLVVQKPGTAVVTAEELEQALAGMPSS